MKLANNQQIEAEIGIRVRRRRLEMNINQTELAARAGLTRRTISSLENGQGCTLSTLIALVRALHVMDWLEGFLSESEINPLELLLLSEKGSTYHAQPVRQKAGRPRKENPPWKWGDET